jgi:hypothetical protein
MPKKKGQTRIAITLPPTEIGINKAKESLLFARAPLN